MNAIVAPIDRALIIAPLLLVTLEGDKFVKAGLSWLVIVAILLDSEDGSDKTPVAVTELFTAGNVELTPPTAGEEIGEVAFTIKLVGEPTELGEDKARKDEEVAVTITTEGDAAPGVGEVGAFWLEVGLDLGAGVGDGDTDAGAFEGAGAGSGENWDIKVTVDSTNCPFSTAEIMSTQVASPFEGILQSSTSSPCTFALLTSSMCFISVGEMRMVSVTVTPPCAWFT